MYMFPGMLSLAFPDGSKKTWKSEDHKKVAEAVLLCNPAITTRQVLIDNAAIINRIPKKKIRLVTAFDLVKLGVSMRFN